MCLFPGLRQGATASPAALARAVMPQDSEAVQGWWGALDCGRMGWCLVELIDWREAGRQRTLLMLNHSRSLTE